LFEPEAKVFWSNTTDAIAVQSTETDAELCKMQSNKSHQVFSEDEKASTHDTDHLLKLYPL
jgi:hypothetical protein